MMDFGSAGYFDLRLHNWSRIFVWTACRSTGLDSWYLGWLRPVPIVISFSFGLIGWQHVGNATGETWWSVSICLDNSINPFRRYESILPRNSEILRIVLCVFGSNGRVGISESRQNVRRTNVKSHDVFRLHEPRSWMNKLVGNIKSSSEFTIHINSTVHGNIIALI